MDAIKEMVLMTQNVAREASKQGIEIGRRESAANILMLITSATAAVDRLNNLANYGKLPALEKKEVQSIADDLAQKMLRAKASA